MNNSICFNQSVFFILLLLLMVACMMAITSKGFPLSQQCPPCQAREKVIVQRVPTAPVSVTAPADPAIIGETDVIRDYDYRKAYDPLEQPARRVNRHEMPPHYVKKYIDLPTRGYPDNFRQLGVLVRKGDQKGDPNNKIIRLFGRQEYPGSDIYEYYVMVNSGHDQIKIPLEKRRKRELYDGDDIFVDVLNAEYSVQLHDYDQPKYYPDII